MIGARSLLRAALVLSLAGSCGTATVESVQSRSCEWQYGVNSSNTQCASQRDRIACYPETNCAGGVFYGLFLQDWLARCPTAPVADYNRDCGRHLRSPQSARAVALVAAVVVLSAGLVVAAGVALALCVCRSAPDETQHGARAWRCCPQAAAPPLAPPPLPPPPANSMWCAPRGADGQMLPTYAAPVPYGGPGGEMAWPVVQATGPWYSGRGGQWGPCGQGARGGGYSGDGDRVWRSAV